MTRWATLAIALLFSAIATVQYTGTAPASPATAGSRCSTARTSTSGTATARATFRIEDGAVDRRRQEGPQGHRVLSGLQEGYKDFELRAEFWVSDDANSGMFVRCTDPKKIGAKTCYEVNIFDKRPDPTYGTGSIVYIAEVNPMPQGRRQVEHLWRSAPRAAQLTVTFNGKKTVDGAENGLFDEGQITLQFGVGTVKFRKIEIKPL